MGRKLCGRHFRWTVHPSRGRRSVRFPDQSRWLVTAMTELARHLDHARELEREQMRLAKRIAELEAQMEQRITGLECRYAESN
jgi:hypothetical protein